MDLTDRARKKQSELLPWDFQAVVVEVCLDRSISVGHSQGGLPDGQQWVIAHAEEN